MLIDARTLAGERCGSAHDLVQGWTQNLVESQAGLPRFADLHFAQRTRFAGCIAVWVSLRKGYDAELAFVVQCVRVPGSNAHRLDWTER